MEDEQIVGRGHWIYYRSLRKSVIKYTKCYLNEAYFRCIIVLQNWYVISINNALTGHSELRRSYSQSIEWALQGITHLTNVLHRHSLLQGHMHENFIVLQPVQAAELPLFSVSNNFLLTGRLRCNPVVRRNGWYYASYSEVQASRPTLLSEIFCCFLQSQ
jgi:hypothetical protein